MREGVLSLQALSFKQHNQISRGDAETRRGRTATARHPYLFGKGRVARSLNQIVKKVGTPRRLWDTKALPARSLRLGESAIPAEGSPKGEMHKTLDPYEIANNSFSVLSVSSVVKSAKFGMKIREYRLCCALRLFLG
jgi:hypothetical protein